MAQRDFLVFFLHADGQVRCPTFGLRESRSGQRNLNICSRAARRMRPEVFDNTAPLGQGEGLLFYHSRVLNTFCCHCISVNTSLFNRVCNMPYGKCEQGPGSSLNAELLLSSIACRQEWLCKDHSTQSSFQRTEKINFRLNNTNKFSPAKGLQPRGYKRSSFCLVTHQETKTIIQQPQHII